jgi:hypothetical protein
LEISSAQLNFGSIFTVLFQEEVPQIAAHRVIMRDHVTSSIGVVLT